MEVMSTRRRVICKKMEAKLPYAIKKALFDEKSFKACARPSSSAPRNPCRDGTA